VGRVFGLLGLNHKAQPTRLGQAHSRFKALFGCAKFYKGKNKYFCLSLEHV